MLKFVYWLVCSHRHSLSIIHKWSLFSRNGEPFPVTRDSWEDWGLVIVILLCIFFLTSAFLKSCCPSLWLGRCICLECADRSRVTARRRDPEGFIYKCWGSVCMRPTVLGFRLLIRSPAAAGHVFTPRRMVRSGLHMPQLCSLFKTAAFDVENFLRIPLFLDMT